MFVGHAAIAFAAVGMGARLLGLPRERALVLGTFAAAAAVVPDLDVLYALSGFAAAESLDPLAITEGFWAASTTVHRSVTHSLVLAITTAAGIGLVASGNRKRTLGLAVFGLAALAIGLNTRAAIWVGVLAFLVGSAILGTVADRLAIGPKAAGLAAAVGLVSHPFGDLFTGQPPWLLYPTDFHLLTGRIALSADPTLHLLGAFFVELAAIWLGVYMVARLRGGSLHQHLKPHAALGGSYALAALVIPAPTLDLAYHFVFSVTAVGMVGAMPSRSIPALTRVVTALAAITLAAGAYAGSYVLLGI